jgi:exodeoxyribonuclease VII large subunit
MNQPVQSELPFREYSVGDLTASIAQLLSREFTGVWVHGEISGLRMASSGHAYFTLKDHRACLKCAVWKGNLRFLRIRPQEGLAVRVRGRLEVYEPRGEYQFIVESMQPVGEGALWAAFDELKRKLAAEGLFDAARKRPLPALAERVGIVTSPQGAVIRDILHVIQRRFPGLHVRLYPAQVQGPGSVEQVVEGLNYFSQSGWAQVVIVARGGGSLEDRWTFNEEAVARAIVRCRVPVISAIGHETDFSIADFAADLRAPTPSSAAEMVTASRVTLVQHLTKDRARLTQAMHLLLARLARRLGETSERRMQWSMQRRLFQAAQQLDEAAGALQRRDIRLRLREAASRAVHLRERLAAAMRRGLSLSAARLSRPASRLQPLNPLQVLARGYSLVTLPGGQALRHPEEAPSGTPLRIRVSHGEVAAQSLGPEEPITTPYRVHK